MHLRHLPTSLNDVSIYVLRRYPQGNVLRYRGVGEKDLLGHVAQGPLPGPEVCWGDGGVVHHQLSLTGRKQTQDDVHQGGLARPGAAGKSQGSAHRDGSVDVPERRCRSMGVGKGDTPQADLSLGQEGMGGRAVDLCQRSSVAEILIYGVHGGRPKAHVRYPRIYPLRSWKQPVAGEGVKAEHGQYFPHPIPGGHQEKGEGQHLSLIHISEPTRLRRISYAVFCLKKKKQTTKNTTNKKRCVRQKTKRKKKQTKK